MGPSRVGGKKKMKKKEWWKRCYTTCPQSCVAAQEEGRGALGEVWGKYLGKAHLIAGEVALGESLEVAKMLAPEVALGESLE